MKKRAVLIGLLLLFITLGAALLRGVRLDAQSLWYDEGFSVYLARMGLAEITARTAADIQPPLYYYLLHLWIGLVGQDEVALRALSLLFGVLSVPLMYGLAWLLFRSRLAGLLAALLMAVSPLHIWYSQEVRMYSLLTFFGLLSSCLLLLIVRRTGTPAQEQAGRPVWQEALLWIGYTLTAILAFYTHYFAFSVLAFQGVYLILVWGAGGFRPLRLLAGGLIAGVVAMLAYAPWLPHLLTRYGTDASYWPGQLKLNQVLVSIAVSYVGGESVPEQVGVFLAIGCGLVAVLCLVALWRQSVTDTRPAGEGGQAAGSAQALGPAVPYPLGFLLLYLLLPPALILLLSYNAPKFNARYVMVSQPALLLILAGGLAALWARRKHLSSRVLGAVVACVLLIFLLGVSAYADYQAYTSRTFARADFRGVARYIQEHAQPDETVILSSGHMFPVFDIYAPGLERHLLPDSPTLDTTATLDYSIVADLNRWLAGKGGVWAVLWQNQVVDPVGYLTSLLDSSGSLQPLDESFAQVELRHYRFASPVHFSGQPQIDHPADVNFGNRLRLLGYSQTGPQQVTLYWEALQPLVEDYLVSIVLRDTNNQVLGKWDGRPAAYLYPTNRWRPGQVVFGRYSLVPMPGTPPGDYGLDVGVYSEADLVGLDVLDRAGAPQGKRTLLGAVGLSVPAVTAGQIDLPNQTSASLGGGLELLGWDLDVGEAQPGDRLLLTTIWSVVGRPLGDYQVRLLVTDAQAQTFEAGIFPPTNAWHPTSIWLPGQAWRGQSPWRLPIQAQPGRATLSVQLLDDTAVPIGPALELGSLQVLPTTRTFTAPAPQVSREANFDGKTRLLGADLAEPVQRASPLRVILYWESLADMDIPYTVFVHLLGPDGKVVAGHDGPPAGGSRPTTSWVPGEYITDAHDVPIPADLPPGEYVVEVGLYDAGAPKMPRLPVLDDEGQAQTDRVIFGPAEVQ